MAVKAINRKHQAMVNRCVELNARYDKLVDNGKDETVRAMNVYSRLVDCMQSLPYREQKNLIQQTTIVL